MNDVLSQTRFRVTGMDCGACATKIDTALRRIPGISDVTVSFQGSGVQGLVPLSGGGALDPVAEGKPSAGWFARASAVETLMPG